MDRKQLQIVRDVFDEVDDEFEDSSTEFVFAVTCERASERLGVEVDAGDVADAVMLGEVG